jgi:hypothetical protein
MSSGTLQEECFELHDLAVGQQRWAVRLRLRGQGLGTLLGALSPAIEGGPIHAQEVSHVGGTFSLVQQFDGTPPSAL